MYLAACGLVASSLLLGTWMGGLFETTIGADKGPTRSGDAWTPISMAFVIVCTSLILINPNPIDPHWLQYTLLLALPLFVGLGARVLLARRLARDNEA